MFPLIEPTNISFNYYLHRKNEIRGEIMIQFFFKLNLHGLNFYEYNSKKFNDARKVIVIIANLNIPVPNYLDADGLKIT